MRQQTDHRRNQLRRLFRTSDGRRASIIRPRRRSGSFWRPARRGQHCRAVSPRGDCTEPVLSLVERLPGRLERSAWLAIQPGPPPRTRSRWSWRHHLETARVSVVSPVCDWTSSLADEPGGTPDRFLCRHVEGLEIAGWPRPRRASWPWAKSCNPDGVGPVSHFLVRRCSWSALFGLSPSIFQSPTLS
jgi:hypothetical protein